MKQTKKTARLAAILIFSLINSPQLLAEEPGNKLSQHAIESTVNPYITSSSSTQSDVQQVLLQAYQQNGNSADPKNIEINTYPVHSALLTAGQVENQSQTALHLPQPIFLVGSDNLSLQWLTKNAVQLQKLHAIGFLVEAQSNEDYQKSKTLIGDTTLIPLSADAFASAWHLKHYPVLISSQGIEQ